jgi:hypothetical protein
VEEEEIMYGFFSKEALRMGCPSYIYTTPNLKSSSVDIVVEVTTVTTDPLGRSYDWKDKVCVGPVDRYLREGKPRRLL